MPTNSVPNPVWQSIKVCFRPLKPFLLRWGLLDKPKPLFPADFFDSSSYWENRYALGGTSGEGSYGELALYKAGILNGFIKEKGIMSVVEFGCGDGNQLALLRIPRYIGLDVSLTAISNLKTTYLTNPSKTFYHYGPGDRLALANCQAELGISLDVIYHLVEDAIFDCYMRDLFAASQKYVIIYSSNKALDCGAKHVRHRNFTDFVEKTILDWTLTKWLENPHKGKSHAEIFVFEKTTS